MPYTLKKYSFQLPIVHGGAVVNSGIKNTENIAGVLKKIKIITPATVDGSATVTINIKDSDGDVIWTKTGIAANTRSINLLTRDQEVPFVGIHSIQAVFSAVQDTTDSTTTVILIVDTK